MTRYTEPFTKIPLRREGKGLQPSVAPTRLHNSLRSMGEVHSHPDLLRQTNCTAVVYLSLGFERDLHLHTHTPTRQAGVATLPLVKAIVVDGGGLPPNLRIVPSWLMGCKPPGRYSRAVVAIALEKSFSHTGVQTHSHNTLDEGVRPYARRCSTPNDMAIEAAAVPQKKAMKWGQGPRGPAQPGS